MSFIKGLQGLHTFLLWFKNWSKCLSSELKNLVRLNKNDFYLVVAAADYRKQLSILAAGNLFEDVMSTNKYHCAALRTDQDVLSAHQQKDVLYIKELVPSM